MAKRRTSFGSSSSEHVRLAQEQTRNVIANAKRVVENAKAQKCSEAFRSFERTAIHFGEFSAHLDSIGRKGLTRWKSRAGEVFSMAQRKMGEFCIYRG